MASTVKSDTLRHYHKYCEILGVLEDGVTPQYKCWDHGGIEAVPLFNIVFDYIFVGKEPQGLPNPLLTEVELGTRIAGDGFVMSIKHMLKSPADIKHELQNNQNVRDVFKRAESLYSDFKHVEEGLGKALKEDWSEEKLQAFLCVHYFGRLNSKIINCKTIQCPDCNYYAIKGKTTVGSENETIHGDLDMIVGSGTNVTVLKEEDDYDSDSPPRKRSIVAMEKKSRSRIEKQVSAQNVVFGFTECNRLRHMPNKPPPKTIVIDRDSYVINFYDADLDVYLRSQNYDLLLEYSVYLLAFLFHFDLFYCKPSFANCLKSRFHNKMEKEGLLEEYKKLDNFYSKRKGEHETLKGEFINTIRKRKAERLEEDDELVERETGGDSSNE